MHNSANCQKFFKTLALFAIAFEVNLYASVAQENTDTNVVIIPQQSQSEEHSEQDAAFPDNIFLAFPKTDSELDSYDKWLSFGEQFESFAQAAKSGWNGWDTRTNRLPPSKDTVKGLHTEQKPSSAEKPEGESWFSGLFADTSNTQAEQQAPTLPKKSEPVTQTEQNVAYDGGWILQQLTALFSSEEGQEESKDKPISDVPNAPSPAEKQEQLEASDSPALDISNENDNHPEKTSANAGQAATDQLSGKTVTSEESASKEIEEEQKQVAASALMDAKDFTEGVDADADEELSNYFYDDVMLHIEALAPEGEDKSIFGQIPKPQMRAKERMTLSDAIRHTLLNSPEIGISDARALRAYHGIAKARAANSFSINVSSGVGHETVINDAGEDVDNVRSEAGLNLEYNIFDFGSTRHEINRQEMLEKSASLRRHDLTLNTALNITKAYLEIFQTDDLIEQAKRNVGAHQRILKLVQASEEAGNSTYADVKRVTTRLERARTILLDLQSRKASAVQAFRRLTRLTPDNLEPPKNLQRSGLSDDQIHNMIEENALIRSLKLDVTALRKMRLAYKSGNNPKLSFEGGANLRNDVGGDTGFSQNYSAMLRLEYNIFDGGLRSASLREISEQIREAEYKLQKKRDEMFEGLKSQALRVENAKEKSDLLNNRADSSEKVLALYLEQFRNGARTVFELLDAQQDVMGAQNELISHSYETQMDEYKKMAIRGTLLREVAGI